MSLAGQLVPPAGRLLISAKFGPWHSRIAWLERACQLCQLALKQQVIHSQMSGPGQRGNASLADQMQQLKQSVQRREKRREKERRERVVSSPASCMMP